MSKRTRQLAVTWASYHRLAWMTTGPAMTWEGNQLSSSSVEETDADSDQITLPLAMQTKPKRRRSSSMTRASPTYKRFFEALGRPTPQWNCFGCKYLCMHKGAKIADVDLRKVFETMAAGIGVCCPMALATEVALLHEKYRRKVNKARKPNEEKIPKWKPSSIYPRFRGDERILGRRSKPRFFYPKAAPKRYRRRRGWL